MEIMSECFIYMLKYELKIRIVFIYPFFPPKMIIIIIIISSYAYEACVSSSVAFINVGEYVGFSFFFSRCLSCFLALEF